MLGVGLPGGRCDFQGRKIFGPHVVPFSIQEVVEEWNDHIAFYECDEVPRQSIAPEASKPKQAEGVSISGLSFSPVYTVCDMPRMLLLGRTLPTPAPTMVHKI
jgi:hypothetical protein